MMKNLRSNDHNNFFWNYYFQSLLLHSTRVFFRIKSTPSWPDPSPAGRQNCKPWSERPQSARADYKSWNNDWSSSILGFRCIKFKQTFDLRIQDVDPQNFILSSLFQNFGWVAALSTTCPHFCPRGLQVLFLLKRTKLQAESCSSWFIRNCKILFF
jgi:hypothetical protein